MTAKVTGPKTKYSCKANANINNHRLTPTINKKQHSLTLIMM